MPSHTADLNINSTVIFSEGQVAEQLRRLERFLGIPLSLRSTTGDVVVKTDYFFGPCSIIRGTEVGRVRCRKTYKNIEDHLLFNRKVPFVNVCYAGFLIFSVPLEFQGEMIGTMFGAQILPVKVRNEADLKEHFGSTMSMVGIRDSASFLTSFANAKHLEPDLQRNAFLDFLKKFVALHLNSLQPEYQELG